MTTVARLAKTVFWVLDTLWTYLLLAANRLAGHRFRVGRGARIAFGSRVWGDIELGDYVYIGPRSQVLGRVTIGMGTRFGGENYIRATRGRECEIVFGSYCAIAPRVSFYSRNHDVSKVALQNWLRKRLGLDEGFVCRGRTVVGDGVWIGHGAIVLDGVEIGSGAVVGAGAIVTRSVEPYSIVVGVPARKIGVRFQRGDVVECLERSRWWTLPPGPELRRLLELLEDYVARVERGEDAECPVAGRQPIYRSPT